MPTIISGDGTITGLTATGISAVQKLPAGTVLQVVSTQSQSVNISTTSTSYVTTNVSASITPASSSSRILLLLNASLDNNASGRQPIITFYRGASDLATTRGINQLYSDSSRVQSSSTSLYIDSPATTSSTTYTVYFKSNGGGSVTFATDNLMVSFILMEIAG
jgi:hypothetical protein